MTTQQDIQTALVLQGGGALGAYEAGTYHEIYKHVSQQRSDGDLFNVVAGTSIGAINASVLVGHYIKNGNSWEGSAEKLLQFWEGLTSPTIADATISGNPAVRRWWDYLHSINPDIADAETARRFWSIFEFSFTTMGVPRMYKPVPQWGSKFLNPFTDFLPWWRYDYQPLREYLSSYVDFPIKTSREKNQPRLLLTSVDVQDYTSAVVFDSYEKLHPAFNGESAQNSGMWYSEYGSLEGRHVVFYDGIGADQVLASALGKYSLDHPTIEDAVTKTKRELWDGGYLSNTPLRELLAAHRRYWAEYRKKIASPSSTRKFTDIPELEVYIVNLHPSRAKDIPTDKDRIDNRENDILFHDRTSYDELVAYLRTDYVTMARKLVDLAVEHGLSEQVDEILKLEAKSVTRAGGELKFVTYRDIIDGRTNIHRTWRIDRRESSEAIFGKTTDFTQSSINDLILRGEADARISLYREKVLIEVERLLVDGTLLPEAAEQVIERIKKMITGDELFAMTKSELHAAFDKYVKVFENLVPDSNRRSAIIQPAKAIVDYLSEGYPQLLKSERPKISTAQ